MKTPETWNAPWLDRIERFIFCTKLERLVGALWLIGLLKTGIWVMPSLTSSFAIAENPFVNPLRDPETHYLFWTWLSPFLAWALRIDLYGEFVALHFALACAFVLLFVHLARARLDDDYARISLALFFALPVSGTAFFWIGPDGLTLCLMSGLVWAARTPWAAFGLASLLGMQHFEQGVFAVFALCVAATLSPAASAPHAVSLRSGLLMLSGLLFGKALLIGVFAWAQIEVNSGRWHWFLTHWPALLRQFASSFQAMLWSVLGFVWLVVIHLAFADRRMRGVWLGLLALTPLLAVAADQTRVLAIVSFPLVASGVLLNPQALQQISRRAIACLICAWALAPIVWVWEGIPRWSVVSDNVRLLLQERSPIPNNTTTVPRAP